MSQTKEIHFETAIEERLTTAGGYAKSITVLREYRTALISAAVTGKIDVRTVPAGRQEETL